MKSRRSFLKLVATGSAAVLAGAATATTTAATTTAPQKGRDRATRSPGAAASASEIRKQKEATAAALEATRRYPLPPGGEPAFVFSPMPVSPRRRRERR